ncbi:MAG: hypothetical protein ACUVQ9_09855 [Thermodesulfobacteriota bacterium]
MSILCLPLGHSARENEPKYLFGHNRVVIELHYYTKTRIRKYSSLYEPAPERRRGLAKPINMATGSRISTSFL